MVNNSVDKEHVNYDAIMMLHVASEMKKGIHNAILYNVYNTAVYCYGYNLLLYIEDYCGVTHPDNIKRIYWMIVYQVLSLTEDRTAKFEEKLKTDDALELLRYIFSFEKELKLEELQGLDLIKKGRELNIID